MRLIRRLACTLALFFGTIAIECGSSDAAQQQDPRLSPIPVVVISARADLDRAVAQIPVAGHLSKPIDIDRLLHIVERHCAEYR